MSTPAGEFATWLGMIGPAIIDGAESDVPCGTCTACCTSAQFIHVQPDEVDTLAHIPAELLFAAPGMPQGNLVLGYDHNGHCPMLVGATCSIYDHRPRTCRSYDCRVFAATGIRPDQPAIAARARTWAFSYADEAAVDLQAEVLARAGTQVEDGPALQRALLALR